MLSKLEILMVHCIRDEVKAFLSKNSSKNAFKLKKEAHEWLFEDDNQGEGPESFVTLSYICRHFNYNINILRSKILLAEKLKLTMHQYILFSASGKLDKILEELHNAASEHGKIQQENSGSTKRPIRKAIKNAQHTKNI